MKECNKCKIKITTNHNYCPLCHQTLTGSVDSGTPEMYPDVDNKYKRIKKRTLRILVFISIASAFGLFITDLLTPQYNYWSVIPIASIFYSLLLMRFAFFTRSSTLLRINTSSVITISLLVFLNIRISTETLWSIDYAMPLFLMANNFVVMMFLLIRSEGIKHYGMNLLVYVLFSFFPLILYFLDYNSYFPLAVLTLGQGILLIAYLFIFHPQDTKELFKKIFHL